jgi:hypothetical protein
MSLDKKVATEIFVSLANEKAEEIPTWAAPYPKYPPRNSLMYRHRNYKKQVLWNP